MTSFQWRHHHYVIEKRHQNDVANFFQICLPSPIKISGYASDYYCNLQSTVLVPQYFLKKFRVPRYFLELVPSAGTRYFYFVPCPSLLSNCGLAQRAALNIWWQDRPKRRSAHHLPHIVVVHSTSAALTRALALLYFQTIFLEFRAPSKANSKGNCQPFQYHFIKETKFERPKLLHHYTKHK